MEEITWNRIDNIITKIAVDVYFRQPLGKCRDDNKVIYNEMFAKVNEIERTDETALQAGKIVAEAILRIQINGQN